MGRVTSARQSAGSPAWTIRPDAGTVRRLPQHGNALPRKLPKRATPTRAAFRPGPSARSQRIRRLPRSLLPPLRRPRQVPNPTLSAREPFGVYAVHHAPLLGPALAPDVGRRTRRIPLDGVEGPVDRERRHRATDGPHARTDAGPEDHLGPIPSQVDHHPAATRWCGSRAHNAGSIPVTRATALSTRSAPGARTFAATPPPTSGSAGGTSSVVLDLAPPTQRVSPGADLEDRTLSARLAHRLFTLLDDVAATRHSHRHEPEPARSPL